MKNRRSFLKLLGMLPFVAKPLADVPSDPLSLE